MNRAGEMADQAAEAIRALNHETMFAETITLADVCSTLGALTELSQ